MQAQTDFQFVCCIVRTDGTLASCSFTSPLISHCGIDKMPLCTRSSQSHCKMWTERTHIWWTNNVKKLENWDNRQMDKGNCATDTMFSSSFVLKGCRLQEMNEKKKNWFSCEKNASITLKNVILRSNRNSNRKAFVVFCIEFVHNTEIKIRRM